MTLGRFIGFAAFAALATVPLSTPASAAEAPAATTPAVDPEALALAKRITSAAFPPERRQEMLTNLMQTMLGQMKSGLGLDEITDPGLHKILEDYLDNIPTLLRPATDAYLPKQMDAIAQAYTRKFTTAQLRDIAAFAETPSGSAYFSHSLEIMSDPAVAEVNTEYFRQIKSISKASQADLQEKVVAYLKAHPDAMKDKSATSDGK
ncbi:DUF2059 domain-containing protein [Novosphingobium sp. 9]|uniref:DUF2059 domain-containing protein n=1 Tax=Novosphingobium sp. 9 TaxID=2025349 RepID=UPI0021B4FE28|nr:DUF2059 domain-containing protein [Novosphingobium sp. 9]